MSKMKIPLAIGLLVLALGACCCPLGALGGEVEFTTGDLPNVPPYPGSTQTTESNPAASGMAFIMSMISDDIEWKHYTTLDSEDDVLDWYEDTMPQRGWEEPTTEDAGQMQTEGALIYVREDDSNVMVTIMALPDTEGGDETHIIIAQIELQ